jgi:hypothetical protein
LARVVPIFIRSVLLVALSLLAPVLQAAPPLAAQGMFVSQGYGFSFQASAGLTYCPLPADWTGSDHGTILFLTPPETCNDAGFPSSARNFAPETTPRIEIYYGLSDRDMPLPACQPKGRVRFLGRMHPLCRGTRAGMTTAQVSARYRTDSMTEAIVTLVTTPLRLQHDLHVLQQLAETAHVCPTSWEDPHRHPRAAGSSPPCPAAGDFY